MKRRDLLKSSLAACALGSVEPDAAVAAAVGPVPAPRREYYEIRAYHLEADSGHELLDRYLEKAAIPALNRIGITRVGAFTVTDPKEATIFLLIPYQSLESFAASAARIEADPVYRKAGAEYLDTPKSRPAFARIDSWLLRAFAGMPRLELPPYCRDRKPRLFELRTYESHSEAKARKKVEMFDAGEIDVMHEVGLAPIFYGQTLVGGGLPHLMYMTSGENAELHAQHWDAFGKHATWNRLKADPQYADTVSRIVKRILAPTSYSQI